MLRLVLPNEGRFANKRPTRAPCVRGIHAWPKLSANNSELYSSRWELLACLLAEFNSSKLDDMKINHLHLLVCLTCKDGGVVYATRTPEPRVER